MTIDIGKIVSVISTNTVPDRSFIVHSIEISQAGTVPTYNKG